MTNPLLETHELPPFPAIKAGHVEPAIEALISINRAGLKAQLESLQQLTWETLVQPIEERGDQLAQAWSPVGHLNGVMNSDALREAYNNCLAKLTQWNTEFGQNEALYQAYQALADSAEFETLPQANREAINHTLRDFRRAGVSLEPERKTEYAALKQRLAELSSDFANNVLDSTRAWTHQITDVAELSGLPEHTVALAAETAREKGEEGYVLTLDQPCFMAVMRHADSRELRETMYAAYTTRASEQGPQAGQWDNGPLIDEILKLRHQMARLLGFNNYAEYSLEPKMADSPAQVVGFLNELVEQALPQAREEFEALKDYARNELQLEILQPWDTGYVTEKLRQHRYAISQEALRPWFPLDRVLEGLFAIANRLYALEIERAEEVETWHEDARYYRMVRNGIPIAGFYIDLFAREHKRGGAWMDVCRSRRKTGDRMQLPVAYITCNFTPPAKGEPALLTHDEITTLFHEFGHGLHHMLTQVDVVDVAGINGVAWDAVELPSQFMENWCWQKDAIELISGHYQSGEPLPEAMLNKLLAAKNFQSATALIRSLEFSLFDFRLHLEYDPEHPRAPQDLLDEIRRQIAVLQPPAYIRFQNSFTHIFAGGYAAGYYSYLWAEVLSADAFSLFEENGIFDRNTGDKFREAILERGGAEEAMALYVKFRGREPTTEPLLRHHGLRP